MKDTLGVETERLRTALGGGVKCAKMRRRELFMSLRQGFAPAFRALPANHFSDCDSTVGNRDSRRAEQSRPQQSRRRVALLVLGRQYSREPVPLGPPIGELRERTQNHKLLMLRSLIAESGTSRRTSSNYEPKTFKYQILWMI
jgi:hypothetical protein